jgi:SAM-dependent methyltransferase
MSEQSHRSDPRILTRRTLQRDHRRLAAVLRPGMSVLDAGCGSGSITAGIARMVGPEGQVLGLDSDESLLALAMEEHHGIPNLRFAKGDVLSLALEESFDVVTAARVLQWIDRPEAAIAQMRSRAVPGGRIVVLDYNHEGNSWEPDPPVEFTRFYKAFLEWRRVNGWNNRMADCLPDLFRSAGIQNVAVHVDDEIARRGEADFPAVSAIWTHVVETVGPKLVAEGFLANRECIEAEAAYRRWGHTMMQTQMLQTRTVEGTIP